MKGEGFHIYCLPRSDLKNYYSLLPLDMRDMAVIPEIRILAAIEEDNRRPAGILIFRFTESMSGAETVGGEILWLFVARGYRRRGLGTGLLSRMTRMLSAEGAGEIFLEFSEAEESGEFTAFLKNRNFLVEENCSLRDAYTLGELKDVFSEYAKVKADGKVLPLAEVSFPDLKKQLAKLLALEKRKDRNALMQREQGFFDPDISCVIKKAGGITAMLLVRKTPSGKLSLQYLGPGEGADLRPLIYEAYQTALYACGKKKILQCRDQRWQKEFASLLEDRGACRRIRAIRFPK